MILLVGIVYSELTIPTGLGPHSCSWTPPGHKTVTPMKQILQVSSLTFVQAEEVEWLHTKVSRKKMPERTWIGHNSSF